MNGCPILSVRSCGRKGGIGISSTAHREPSRRLGSCDLPSASRPWSTEVPCGMLRARISHLRGTATFTHALVCFRPRRNLCVRLRPVCDGCLIAPFQKMRHRGLVRPRQHELPHTLLAVPECDRPKGPSSIGQQRARLKSPRAFYLPQRPPRVKREERKKSNRADSEPCQANECHSRSTQQSLILRIITPAKPDPAHTSCVHSAYSFVFCSQLPALKTSSHFQSAATTRFCPLD
jgi:hypothetical protein